MATIPASVRQKIQIPYNYVAGFAVSRFLLGLKEKIIYASSCAGCGNVHVPPESFCGRCWGPIEKFVQVGPEGVLESYAEIPASGGEEPQVLGLVRLQGASNVLLHRLGIDTSQLRVGMPVVAIWDEQRSGGILDIAHFGKGD